MVEIRKKTMNDKYKKLGNGSLSKNQYKEGNQPDFKGKLIVEEELQPGEYSLSGWKREGDYGEFISLSLQPKYEKKKKTEKQESLDF
jgi:hypothetical protein